MSGRHGGGDNLILRRAIVGTVLSIAIFPTLPLLFAALSLPRLSQVPLLRAWTVGFSRAMQSTLMLGASVASVSLAIGLSLGLLAALYRFPGRRTLITFQLLPLLLPSFLLSIGWSNLATMEGIQWIPVPNGLIGCILVLGLQMMPLPFFATWAACQSMTASQIDAARLHGGEAAVVKLTAHACASSAVLAALLGGILSMTAPGAPLIFGCRSVAVEIRTSASALFDMQLAGQQSLLLAGVTLSLTGPLLFFGLNRLAQAVLARQTRPGAAYRHTRMSRIAACALSMVLLVGVILPALGLCLPAMHNPLFGKAFEKTETTLVVTLLFTGGAALVAVGLATVLALATANDSRARLATLAILIVLFVLPPGMAALGVLKIAASGPAQLDWLLRSRSTVGLMLGLRFLPVATLVLMRAVGSLSPSWFEAARLHGVRGAGVLARILLPCLGSAITVSLLLVMVLAAADITTTHLLQPPGDQSLPVAIFTVMANAPEGLVASLCLIYLATVVGLLTALSLFTSYRPVRSQ